MKANAKTKDHSRLQKLVEDERGANLVEYIILVGVVALIALAGYSMFGDTVQTKIENQAGTVDAINDTEGG